MQLKSKLNFENTYNEKKPFNSLFGLLKGFFYYIKRYCL